MDINDLRYDELQEWISSGKSKTLPKHLVEYLEQLEVVRSLYSKYESKAFIIRTLKLTYKLTDYLANKVYAEALNFFYSSNEVKVEAWANIYAEKLENAALAAWDLSDYETYGRLIVEAAKLRGVGKDKPQEIPKDFYQRPVVIYTLKPEDVGLESVDRKTLAKFIDELPEINEKQKLRLKRDAMVEDVKIFEDDPQENKAD